MLAIALLAAPLLQGTAGLLEELAGSDRAVQSKAIEALASSLDNPGPEQEIATALAKVVVEDDDPEVRRACIEALGRRGDTASLATLAELVRSLPPREQVLATRSLGDTPAGRTRAWELLGGLLESDAAAAPWAGGQICRRLAAKPPELPSAEAPRSRLRLRPQQPLARRGGMAPPRRRRCPPGAGRRSTTSRA